MKPYLIVYFSILVISITILSSCTKMEFASNNKTPLNVLEKLPDTLKKKVGDTLNLDDFNLVGLQNNYYIKTNLYSAPHLLSYNFSNVLKISDINYEKREIIIDVAKNFDYCSTSTSHINIDNHLSYSEDILSTAIFSYDAIFDKLTIYINMSTYQLVLSVDAIDPANMINKQRQVYGTTPVLGETVITFKADLIVGVGGSANTYKSIPNAHSTLRISRASNGKYVLDLCNITLHNASNGFDVDVQMNYTEH